MYQSSIQPVNKSITHTTITVAATGFLLEAAPVKAIGELEGPVTALALGTEALGADEVEVAASTGDA